MATIGSLNVKMTANANGFTQSLSKAAKDTDSFVKRVKTGANSIFTFGGTLETLNKGFTLTRHLMTGFGIGIAGELIPNVVKGIRSLAGYSEEQEKLRESAKAATEELRKQRDEMLLGKDAAAERKLQAEGGSTPQEVDERIRLRNEIAAIQEQRANKAKVDDIVKGLKDEIDKMTMSREAIIDNQLAELKASDATRRRVELLVKKAEALKAEKKAQEEATKAAADAARERGRAAAEQLRKLDQAFERQRDRIKQAQEARLKAKPELPSGAEFGTADAVKRVAEITAEEKKSPEDQRQSDLLREAIQVLNGIKQLLGAPQQDPDVIANF